MNAPIESALLFLLCVSVLHPTARASEIATANGADEILSSTIYDNASPSNVPSTDPVSWFNAAPSAQTDDPSETAKTTPEASTLLLLGMGIIVIGVGMGVRRSAERKTTKRL